MKTEGPSGGRDRGEGGSGKGVYQTCEGLYGSNIEIGGNRKGECGRGVFTRAIPVVAA